MSENQQHDLPDTFAIHLQRHNDNWHVTKFADHRYPAGDASQQPDYEMVNFRLSRLGYEPRHEVPNTAPGTRIIEYHRPPAPTIFESVLSDSGDSDTPDTGDTPDTPDTPDSDSGDGDVDEDIRAGIQRKHGRL